MRKEVRWERMFPDELEAAFERCPLAWLPYGLCEPHGPQSALGMDALRAHGFLRRAAEEFGGIVAPPNFWNIHELGIYAAWAYQRVGEVRPWLTAVPPWVFFKDICYHLRAMEALGFHAVVLYSGHAGPHSEDLHTLQELLQPHFAARLALLSDGDIPIGAPGGHGGAGETSVLWALEPDCVDLSRLPAPDYSGPPFAMGEDAAEASRRLGEELVERKVKGLIALAQELLEAYEREKPQRRVMTYDDVERLWDEVVRPRFSDFASMQDLRLDQEPPPKDSRWYPQWKVPPRS